MKYPKHFIFVFTFLTLSQSLFAQQPLCVRLEGLTSDCSGGGAGVPGEAPPPPPAEPQCSECPELAAATCSGQSFTCKGRAGCPGTKCCGNSCQCPQWQNSTFIEVQSRQQGECQGWTYECGSANFQPKPDQDCSCTCVKSGADSCTAQASSGCASCSCNPGTNACSGGFGPDIVTCKPSPTSCLVQSGTTSIPNPNCQSCSQICAPKPPGPICAGNCTPSP